MIRVVILYPNTKNNWFNKDYYINQHIPMVQNLLEPYGLEKFELEKGVAGLDGPAPFLAIGYLTFTSLEHFQKGMDSEGKNLMADIPNYTRDFIVQVGEIVDILQTA